MHTPRYEPLENWLFRDWKNTQYLEFSNECVLSRTPHFFMPLFIQQLSSCSLGLCLTPGPGLLLSLHSIELSHSLESDLAPCGLTRVVLTWLCFEGPGVLADPWGQSPAEPHDLSPKAEARKGAHPQGLLLGSF